MDPIPVGDEVDAADPATELPAAPAQMPDAIRAVLPPSNSKGELDVPALDVSMPDVVPMLVLAAPKDACGIEPPMPPDVVRLLIAGGSGEVPDVIGLTPSADAEPQLHRTAVIVTINKRVIARFSSSRFGLCVRCSATTSTTKSNYPRGRDLMWLATICPLLRRLLATGCGAHSTFLLAW
jgi:hypothetical protein